MKKKLYTAIGLMSGTSMDGIDLSIISSDGYDEFSNILDDYYEYDKNLQDQLVRLRDLVLTKKDLLQNSEKLRELERNLTLFHADAVNQSLKKYRDPIDLIGFHGQTIFHHVLSKKINQNFNIKFPIGFLNIGGISNVTKVKNDSDDFQNNLSAFDIGPVSYTHLTLPTMDSV